MARTFAIPLVWILMAVPSPVESQEKPSAEKLTIVFSSGRKTKAYLDPRTDERRLWLRFGTDRTQITRSLDWDTVSVLAGDGNSLSPAKVQEIARASRPPGPVLPRIHVAQAERHSELEPTVMPGIAVPRQRTQTLRFDAEISNWDADVETDGLIVQFFPLSANGMPTSVRGRLSVELWAMKAVEQDSEPHSAGRSLRRLEHWTVPVDTEIGDNSQNWVRLPFQMRHPEFDVNWSSVGLVHLELVVPGQGVFHHTVDGVRIRPFAPFRDALQVQTGERFLPTELNGRN